MRILICNWRDLKHPLAGGAEVYTDAVATEWVKMGHSVTLFCAAVEGEPERDKAAGGYLVVRRGTKHGVYREARRFWRNEGSGNFDRVIEEVNTRPFFCKSFVGNIPVVVLIYQVAREIWFYESWLPVALVGRFILEPWWLRRLRNAKVVTISESSRRSLEEYGIQDIQVVPVGFRPLERPEVVKEATPTMIFVGRLSSNKRPMDAIKAFEIIKQRLPDAKMWVIGDGPERRKLEEKTVDGVEFLGRVSESEKAKRLAGAHMLVVTSVREGWGMVVTEAALMGTPAIGYLVDGLRDSLAVHGGYAVSERPKYIAERVIRFFGESSSLRPKDGFESGLIASWNKVAAEINK